MKRYLPNRTVLILFALLAVAFAAITGLTRSQASTASILVFPTFLGASVLGLWRSGRLRAGSDDD